MSDPRSAVRSLFAASSAPSLSGNAKSGGKASKETTLTPSTPLLNVSTEFDEAANKAESASSHRSKFRDRAAERRAGLTPALFVGEVSEKLESSAAIPIVEDATLDDRRPSKMAMAIIDLFQQPTPDNRPKTVLAAQRMAYAYNLNSSSSGFSWMPRTIFQSQLESDLLRSNGSSDKGSRLDFEAQRRSACIGREALSKIGTTKSPSRASPLLAKKTGEPSAAPPKNSDLLTRPKLFDDLSEDEDAIRKPKAPVLLSKTKDAEQKEAEGGLFGYSHLLPRLHRFDVDTPDLPRGAVTYDVLDPMAEAGEQDPLVSFSSTIAKLQPMGQREDDEELFPGVLEPAHPELLSDLEDEARRPVSRKRKAAKQDRRLDSQAKKIEHMLSHPVPKK